MIKKLISIILVILALLPLGVACTRADDGRTTVLCTTFPLYDWARRVIGEDSSVNLELLVSDGSDLHSYNASVEDIMKIKNAEMVLRVGGVSDAFMDDLIPKTCRDIRLSEAEGVVTRVMQKESHSHTEGDGHKHTEDEHIWLSLKNAIASTEAICAELSALDSQNAPTYRANADKYISELAALDGRYLEAVSEADTPRLIFADRFPFVYMTEDYGIEFCAAFEGCTTDSDATVETVVRLANKLDTWKTGKLCVTETSDKRLAQSVINASKAKKVEILVFNSLQSVNYKAIATGTTYIGVMESNLAVLVAAI